MTDAYVQGRRRRGELTPLDALRRGLCPICREAGADTDENGEPWIMAPDCGGVLVPICCCEPCWSRESTISLTEADICRSCPLLEQWRQRGD